MLTLEQIDNRIKYLKWTVDPYMAKINGYYSSDEKASLDEIKSLTVLRQQLIKRH